MLGRMLVAASMVATAISAQAAELDVLRAGAEVFRTARDGANLVENRWTLYPDGTYRGVESLSRNAGRAGVYTETHPSHGRWSAQGDRLCLEGSGLLEGPSACMRVDKVEASTSPYQYSASSEGSGRAWDLFIYPDGG